MATIQQPREMNDLPASHLSDVVSVIEPQTLSNGVLGYVRFLVQHPFSIDVRVDHRRVKSDLAPFLPAGNEAIAREFLSYVEDIVHTFPVVEINHQFLLRITASNEQLVPLKIPSPEETASIVTLDAVTGIPHQAIVLNTEHLPPLDFMGVRSGVMIFCQPVPPLINGYSDLVALNTGAGNLYSERSTDKPISGDEFFDSQFGKPAPLEPDVENTAEHPDDEVTNDLEVEEAQTLSEANHTEHSALHAVELGYLAEHLHHEAANHLEHEEPHAATSTHNAHAFIYHATEHHEEYAGAHPYHEATHEEHHDHGSVHHAAEHHDEHTGAHPHHEAAHEEHHDHGLVHEAAEHTVEHAGAHPHHEAAHEEHHDHGLVHEAAEHTVEHTGAHPHHEATHEEHHDHDSVHHAAEHHEEHAGAHPHHEATHEEHHDHGSVHHAAEHHEEHAGAHPHHEVTHEEHHDHGSVHHAAEHHDEHTGAHPHHEAAHEEHHDHGSVHHATEHHEEHAGAHPHHEAANHLEHEVSHTSSATRNADNSTLHAPEHIIEHAVVHEHIPEIQGKWELQSTPNTALDVHAESTVSNRILAENTLITGGPIDTTEHGEMPAHPVHTAYHVVTPDQYKDLEIPSDQALHEPAIHPDKAPAHPDAVVSSETLPQNVPPKEDTTPQANLTSEVKVEKVSQKPNPTQELRLKRPQVHSHFLELLEEII